MGRFLSSDTNALTGRHTEHFGAPFEILTIAAGGGVFTTDVIHHEASNQFIVGYAEVGQRTCDVANVVISGDPAVFPPRIARAPMAFSGCDYDTGGHPTSSAYDARGDGTYVWWRQPKKIFVHGADGMLTSDPAYDAFPDTQMTVPVASTGDAAMPYAFLTGPERLMGLRADKTWTELGAGTGTGPIALRALAGGIVGLAIDGRGIQDAGLHLTIWDMP
jgi:hypothetical protein